MRVHFLEKTTWETLKYIVNVDIIDLVQDDPAVLSILSSCIQHFPGPVGSSRVRKKSTATYCEAAEVKLYLFSSKHIFKM